MLADPGREGMNALEQTYASGSNHELVMAFSLLHLESLLKHLKGHEANEGTLRSKALGAHRQWPLWHGQKERSFFVLPTNKDGLPRPQWVRAACRSEAVLGVAEKDPTSTVLSVGELESLSKHIDALMDIVKHQDYGCLWTDIRQTVVRPASRAHIGAYPLAEAGFFASPQEAMAFHHALALEDELESAHE